MTRAAVRVPGRARVRSRPTGQYDSQLNADWARVLELRQAAGEIEGCIYEGVSLRLAKGARYKPDFFVVLPSGEIELHEVKGVWQEAAKVRIKVAASLYPWFRFVVVTRPRGRWEIEEVSA